MIFNRCYNKESFILQSALQFQSIQMASLLGWVYGSYDHTSTSTAHQLYSVPLYHHFQMRIGHHVTKNTKNTSFIQIYPHNITHALQKNGKKKVCFIQVVSNMCPYLFRPNGITRSHTTPFTRNNKCGSHAACIQMAKYHQHDIIAKND